MLPDLVENLLALIASQYTEADRTICGSGNFILRPSHQQYRLSIASLQFVIKLIINLMPFLQSVVGRYLFVWSVFPVLFPHHC